MERLSKSKLKWLRSLRLEKYRRKEQCFIVYGEKIIRELLDENPALIEMIASTDDGLCREFEGFSIDAAEMKSVSELSSPGNILAVVRIPKIEAAYGDLTLVLDGIQDPGNMGTIIRTADWFGVSMILCSEDTVSITNPKVVQSSMGSVFRVAVRYGNLHELLSFEKKPLYGALLNGKNLKNLSLEIPAYLVIGNEGKGISAEIRELVDHPVFIPSFGKAESLNASIATGILLSAFRLH